MGFGFANFIPAPAYSDRVSVVQLGYTTLLSPLVNNRFRFGFCQELPIYPHSTLIDFFMVSSGRITLEFRGENLKQMLPAPPGSLFSPTQHIFSRLLYNVTQLIKLMKGYCQRQLGNLFINTVLCK